uniref:Ral GTPase-activating protein subunit alpha/beta N-terminal domain-containing protein n=1 Tax=Panagrolaimus davidi TaxID=227884 RepID=A0A914PE55_9BILA
MEMYEQWPLLEFSNIKDSILSKFSIDAGTSVAHLLVKELADGIDDPSTGSKISTEQDLEWIMQIINHAFSLPFSSKDYETIRGAIKIYLTWTSALTVDVHPSCPTSLRDHPDRYFRRILDAMRYVFTPREAVDNESGNRQAIEMRNILSALEGLSEHIIDEFKDEAWSKLILFLLEVNSQMLDDPKVFDDFYSPVASELIGTLLTCWITASLQEYIPSPAYWKTFTSLARKWVVHVPLIEHWGRKVLPLASIMLQKSYNTPHWGPSVEDEKLLRLIPLNSETKVPKELSETWFRTFHLLGTPSKILATDSANSEHLSLSFFLSVLVHVRLIDIIYGDTEVSMNFQESEEVHQLWQDACKELQDEWSKSYHHTNHRLSNLSNQSIPHSASMENTPMAQHQQQQQQNSGASSVGRKNALIIPGNRQIIRGSTRNNPFSIHKEPASAPVIIDESQPPPFCEPARPKLGQFVYHYLKTNQFRKLKRSFQPLNGVSTNIVLDVFLYFLGDAAQASSLLQYSIRHHHQQGHEGK